MSFSASPHVSGPSNGAADGWSVAAELVARAVGEALTQIPSPAPLQAGAPVPAGDPSVLPAGVTTAVTAFLSGAREGSLLIVVGQDLQAALSATPFGDVEPAQALRPALETLADTLGGRLDGAPTAIPAEGCLDVLAGAASVVVPLLADGVVVSAVGVSFAQPPVVGGGASGGGAGAVAAGRWGIDMLRDVEMEVTCELGRTRMTVRQLLALAPGDVVELDRLAGAPADLLVNGTLLARGEVVVIDESFGLRITEIVTKDAT
ncbi:MAG: flagellar motor switch protein FliN [Kineosporiaceae bacterium]